ncbi:hypothetical protein LCGC14_0691500 [marine sediment metagenome]|uniref:Uncharacterized protein n=1 Tax=marine sediment metagenome TaxID=412755 RepID=A0A0F9R5P9_9ZZZZ
MTKKDEPTGNACFDCRAFKVCIVAKDMRFFFTDANLTQIFKSQHIKAITLSTFQAVMADNCIYFTRNPVIKRR